MQLCHMIDHYCSIHLFHAWRDFLQCISYQSDSLKKAIVKKKLHAFMVFTPHAQRERGKVIGRGVHIIYIYMSVVEKKI